ncbi:zinc-ribbon domain-containing protein [Nocardia sp. CA-120079]|uniref:zinc-ribbon domain-containing protein n=1 Tax=Nocardia sp. CA-120079 TaxID=3239974 RepID=UPI003D999C99
MITLVCGRCGNPAAHALRRLATTFTIFFIPILPLGNKHYIECTWCGASTPLAVPQVTGLIARANAEKMGSTQPQQPHGQWPQHPGPNAHPQHPALVAPNTNWQHQPALGAPIAPWQQPAPGGSNAPWQQQPGPNTPRHP